MYGHGAPSPPRLRVYETVGEAFRLTFRNFRTMLGLALAPMVLAVLLPAVMRLDLQTDASSVQLVIHAIARLFLLSVFAVAWHRYLLLGTRDTSVPIQFWPSARDVKYFGRLILFLLPQEIILVAMQAHDLLLVLVLLLITLFVAAPFALAFPATAVDNYQGLMAARRASCAGPRFSSWARSCSPSWRSRSSSSCWAGCSALWCSPRSAPARWSRSSTR